MRHSSLKSKCSSLAKRLMTREGSSDPWKIFDETTIEPSMDQEAMDSLDIDRRWKLFYYFNLGSIHLYPSFKYKVR